MILHHCLSAWAESDGIREPAQTGFRPHHATSHHAFVLQHHITKYKAANKKLYRCFIDFAKAYDSVPRHKLWQRLYDLGIRGRILHGIKSLYDMGVTFSIKLDAGLLDPIDVAVGVKQGCPLSPLFGLYIEDLETLVKAKWPTAGPATRGVYMSLLMYADDTAVLANSITELQSLLDCIQEWCTEHGMTINVDNLKLCVVFNTTAGMLLRRGTQWSIGGEHIKVSQCFKYLTLSLQQRGKVWPSESSPAGKICCGVPTPQTARP
jgi:hypothetical protein